VPPEGSVPIQCYQEVKNFHHDDVKQSRLVTVAKVIIFEPGSLKKKKLILP
jgi:hypothetical protein